MREAALQQIQNPINKLYRSLMGALVQQAFIRHAAHGEQMLNS